MDTPPFPDGCDLPGWPEDVQPGWFSIDRDGHLAFFELRLDPDEVIGAYPKGPHLLQDARAVLQRLRSGARTSEIYDLAGYTSRSTNIDLRAERHLTVHGSHSDALMLPRDPQRVRQLAAHLRIDEIATSEGSGFLIHRLDEPTHRLLHRKKTCEKCFSSFESESEPEIAAFGVYHYEHPFLTWVPSAYQRMALPAEPITERDLPAELVAVAARFPGRFSETRCLQPIEVWPCEETDVAWLASDDRTITPFPGKEQEYLGLFDWMVEREPHLDHYVFVNLPLPRRNRTEPPTPWWKFW